MDDNKFVKEQEEKNALGEEKAKEKMDSYEREAAMLEEIALDTNTMAVDVEFPNKQDKDKKDKKESSFFKRLLEGVVDQTVILLLSLMAFFVVDLIMRPFGYKISLEGRIPFYFVIFVIMNIIYRAVMTGKKFKLTIGERVFRK